MGRPTQVVADSSEYGMQGSIYQEKKHGKGAVWVPIDHTSRAIATPTKYNYSPIERESLAQSCTIEQFRFYSIGSWSVHAVNGAPIE